MLVDGVWTPEPEQRENRVALGSVQISQCQNQWKGLVLWGTRCSLHPHHHAACNALAQSRPTCCMQHTLASVFTRHVTYEAGTGYVLSVACGLDLALHVAQGFQNTAYMWASWTQLSVLPAAQGPAYAACSACPMPVLCAKCIANPGTCACCTWNEPGATQVAGPGLGHRLAKKSKSSPWGQMSMTYLG